MSKPREIFRPTVRKSGNSIVITLPAEMVYHYKLKIGDVIRLEYLGKVRR